MNTHSVDLDGYYARSRGSSTIYLGTAGSHGNEQLQVTQGKGWEGLTVQVVFHPSQVAVQLPANGLLDVPWEATENPLTAMQGRIVFQGFDQDRLVNSTDLAYTVASHSAAVGRDEEPYTPGIVEGVLNQMAADKNAILQAAQQTGQAKEAAAASAENAQQSADAANTSAGLAAASASQAAGSAVTAGETLTQVQTAGQEAEQKVKDAETAALNKIAEAAPALPTVSADVAWQSVTVKPDGTGYNLSRLAPIESTIRPTTTGNPAVCENSVAWGLQGLKIYGKSVQDGTPSLKNPVPIVSTGDEGKTAVYVTGHQLLNFPNKSGTAGGICWTCKNGKISAQGTSSGISSSETVGIVTAIPIVAGSYFISGSSKNITVYVQVEGSDGFQYYSDKTFKLCGNETSVTAYAQISAGKTLNETVNPMLNYGITSLPWAPYTGQSITLSTPNGLPGIPVDSGGNYTDEAGQQWACDMVDLGVGIYTQNLMNVTLDGSEDEAWRLQSGTSLGNRYLFTLDPSVAISETSNVASLNSTFPLGDNGATYNKSYCYTITNGSRNESILYVALNGSETLEEFRAYLQAHPMQLLAQLTKPQTNPISTEELAAYRDLQTYPGITVVSTAEPVAGLEAQYVADGTKYVEKVQSIETRLAFLEAAQTGI